jgi:anti-anti-sigma regulatory factor
VGIQDWSDDIVLVDLPAEPEMKGELKSVVKAMRERGRRDSNLVIDFSNVDIITADSIAEMLRLNKMLSDCDRKLVFCSVKSATMGIFTVLGLDDRFDFADDKFVALASLQMTM